MEVKNRLSRWTTLVTMSIVIMAGLTACEENSTSNPETPIEESDWNTIPTTGGVIEKGDITIVFPSGTFSEEARVAVTEVPANNVVGAEACSKFYHVILPATGTDKNFTISIKKEGTEGDVDMVAKMPGWNSHTGTFSDSSFYLDTYSSGEEVATSIPIMSSDGKEQPYFTIGLVEGHSTDNEEYVRTRASNKYQFEFKWDYSIYGKYKGTGYLKSMENILYVRIPKAFEVLENLKFELPSTKIKYVYKDLGETWGNWVTSKWSNIGYVELNAKRFLNYAKDSKNENLAGDIDKTLIHETSHAIQAICYDTRWFKFKQNIQEHFGDEWAMVSEAIGSWSEKFAGDKHLGDNSTRHAGSTNVKAFMREFIPHYWSGSTYQHHGYGMSVFIEYLSTKTGNDKIAELYKYQKDGLSWLDALKKFMTTHGIIFFTDNDYYTFASKVLKSELESEIKEGDISDDFDIDKDEEVAVKDTAFNYGVHVKHLDFRTQLLKNISKKSICLTENEKGTKTYIYCENKNAKRELILLGEIAYGKSFEIPIEDYCKAIGYSDVSEIGGRSLPMILVTTREKNHEYSNSFIDRFTYIFKITEQTASLSNISVTFEDADKTPVEISIIRFDYNSSAKGYVNSGLYSGDFIFSEPAEDTIKAVRNGNDVLVSATKAANLYDFIESEKTTISFTIKDYKNGTVGNVTDLNVSHQQKLTDKDDYEKLEIQATDVTLDHHYGIDSPPGKYFDAYILWGKNFKVTKYVDEMKSNGKMLRQTSDISKLQEINLRVELKK